MYIMLTSIKEIKRSMCDVKKRILYIDIIKVFALLFVIFNHSDDILISSKMYIRIIHNSLFYLSKSAVPLFLMVSGSLLMEKKDSIPKLIKRIIRVLIPLIIITIIWTMTHSNAINILGMIDPFNVNYFPYWLWYLQALLLLYILMPLIRIITLKNKDKSSFKYIIIILTLLSSITFTVVNIIFKKNQLVITNLLPMPILYFIYGYILSKTNNKKIVKNISFITLIIAISIPAYIATNLMLKKQSYFFLDDYRNIYTFIISTSLFIIIKYYFEKYRKENIFTKVITHLSNNSYGIYLLHVFVIELLLKTEFIKQLIEFNKLEGLFVLIILVVIILDIIISILRKIPGIKNIL